MKNQTYLQEPDVCKFCKIPCNMPHCPYTKQETKQHDCHKKKIVIEKEKECLLE
jgi:hypothetical protein